MTSLGKTWKLSAETRQRQSEARKKLAQSPEVKENMRRIGLSNKGKPSSQQFEKHWAWKGDDVGYGALHSWVKRKLGSPLYCQLCQTQDTSKTYNWANISQEYHRDLSDWLRLCRSCHLVFDDTGRKSWVTRRANKNV